MKKLFPLLLALISLSACQNQSSLILTGTVDGLLPGDTLFLAEFELPLWNELSVDTFFVTQANELRVEKPISHTTFFILNHAPKDAPRMDFPIRGVTFLALPGDEVVFNGSVETFVAMQKKGGFYDYPPVARLDAMEFEQDLKTIGIWNKITEAKAAKDSDSIAKYSEMYSNRHRPKAIRNLRDSIRNEEHNNEYAAFLYLQSLHGVTGSQLEERFAKFTPEVQMSYIGQQLNSMLTVLKNIEPGNTPSDFEVTDRNATPLKLSDYRGKYTLIYHWGLCPGTIWVHPRLLKLYEEYHEKGFEVIGFTPYNFFETHPDLEKEESITPLFNQPWRTVFTDTPGNEFITDSYYFSGVPIMMLISPEGVTLERGYSEVYSKLKKILKENL
ncbi:TlpA family protein disulfide reductase [Bacteroides sp. 214]|uniref:peroxiredoxin family protein n=1 Tax=Bacteroides sp. 214 TaxID=2302935 RepID=UPI0013D11FD6|nr:TlpA disulfide reductase family protein [Bacteroides sp. 214]NDW11347.1 TlpA family protein disulfide reductase [Bacteroides sp. 214]